MHEEAGVGELIKNIASSNEYVRKGKWESGAVVYNVTQRGMKKLEIFCVNQPRKPLELKPCALRIFLMVGVG